MSGRSTWPAYTVANLSIMAPPPHPVSSGQLPVEPRAEGASHDQLVVLCRQPRELLREHRHALPPRARHARDVGAPEHPLGAEGVVDLAEVSVDVAIGIGRAGIARRAGGLDRDVRM